MTTVALAQEFNDDSSLLTKTQQNKFKSIYYTAKGHLDCVEYDSFKMQRNGESIICCGYLAPHDDIECGHQECWVIQALHVDEEEQPCIVHTLACGEIVANTLTPGKHYSFLYKKLHAVVPIEVAKSMVEKQSFDTEVYRQWNSPRTSPDYKEGAKLAFTYIDNLAADITQYDFR